MVTAHMPNVIALIPARAGSTRVPHKNIRRLGSHPLLAYAISGAIDSGVFAAIVVSTDSERYAHIARYYGAEVPFLRPVEFRDRDIARYRMGPLHTRPTERGWPQVRLLRHSTGHQPIPITVHHSPRLARILERTRY